MLLNHEYTQVSMSAEGFQSFKHLFYQNGDT